jgi:outer membrane protein assembly factor BamE (lipoprotein component of BamABCDE complex)
LVLISINPRRTPAGISLVVLVLLTMLPACTVNVRRYAFNAALENQKHIDKLRIGQTLAEVERIMGKPPERRNAHVRFDGISIEEWSYLTDYVRRMDTTITFVGGKVDEIRAAPWESD